MRTLPSSSSSLPLFVFGTLLDADIRRIVLGPRARPLRFGVCVTGFRCHRVEGETYPLLVQQDAASEAVNAVHGALVHGLCPHALARLRFYEGPGYALRTMTVEVGRRRRRCRARVFLGTDRLRDSGQPWTLDHWQRTEKPLALMLARDLMALYGRIGADGPPDPVWEDIKMRCRARLQAPAFL